MAKKNAKKANKKKAVITPVKKEYLTPVLAGVVLITVVAAGVIYTNTRGYGKKEIIQPVQAAASVQPAASADLKSAPVKKAVSMAPEFRYLLKDVKKKEDIPKIHINEASALFDSGRAVFIDTRGPNMYKVEHIKGSIELMAGSPPADYERFADVFKGKVLVPYCHGVGCHLADKAAHRLYDMGYRKVAIFFGGWNEWKQAGKETQGYVPPERFARLFKDAPSASEIGEASLEEVKFLYDEAAGNILDVDTAEKYNQIRIDRAASMPYENHERLIASYAEALKSKPAVVYCHGSGKKAREVAAKLYEAGARKIFIMPQALEKWQAAGYPVFKQTN